MHDFGDYSALSGESMMAVALVRCFSNFPIFARWQASSWAGDAAADTFRGALFTFTCAVIERYAQELFLRTQYYVRHFVSFQSEHN